MRPHDAACRHNMGKWSVALHTKRQQGRGSDTNVNETRTFNWRQAPWCPRPPRPTAHRTTHTRAQRRECVAISPGAIAGMAREPTRSCPHHLLPHAATTRATAKLEKPCCLGPQNMPGARDAQGSTASAAKAALEESRAPPRARPAWMPTPAMRRRKTLATSSNLLSLITSPRTQGHNTHQHRMARARRSMRLAAHPLLPNGSPAHAREGRAHNDRAQQRPRAAQVPQGIAYADANEEHGDRGMWIVEWADA